MLDGLHIGGDAVRYRGSAGEFVPELMARTNSLSSFVHLETCESSDTHVTVSSGSVRAWKSLAQVQSVPVPAKLVAAFATQAHNLFETCARNDLFLKGLVLDAEFVFCDTNTYDFKFLYLPFSDVPAEVQPKLDFLKSLPMSFTSSDDASARVLDDWRIKMETLRSFNPSAIQKILKETASDAATVATSQTQERQIQPEPESLSADSTTSELQGDDEPLGTSRLSNDSNGMPEPVMHRATMPAHEEKPSAVSFARVQSGLQQAVATCMQPTYMTNYTPGQIRTEPWFASLADALGESQTYQSENYEKMLMTESTLAEQKQTRIQYEYEQAAAKKEFWAGIGTAFAVAGLVIGVGLLVSTTGPIGIGFAVKAGFMMLSAEKVGERIVNYNDIKSGAAEADLNDSDISDAQASFQFMGDVYDDDMKDAYSGLGSYAADKTFGGGTETVLKAAGVDDDMSETVGDMVGEFSGEVVDVMTDPTYGIGDVATFGTKIVTAVADYGADQADAQLDACNKEFENIEKTRTAIENSTGPATCSWAA